MTRRPAPCWEARVCIGTRVAASRDRVTDLLDIVLSRGRTSGIPKLAATPAAHQYGGASITSGITGDDDVDAGCNSPGLLSHRLMHDIMSTKQPLRRELQAYNASLDARLRSRYGMTLKTFKTVKASTQLVGAAAGIYAMSLGADPMTALMLVAVMVSGPEVLEYIINTGTD